MNSFLLVLLNDRLIERRMWQTRPTKSSCIWLHRGASIHMEKKHDQQTNNTSMWIDVSALRVTRRFILMIKCLAELTWKHRIIMLLLKWLLEQCCFNTQSGICAESVPSVRHTLTSTLETGEPLIIELTNQRERSRLAFIKEKIFNHLTTHTHTEGSTKLLISTCHLTLWCVFVVDAGRTPRFFLIFAGFGIFISSSFSIYRLPSRLINTHTFLIYRHSYHLLQFI